MRWCVRPIAEQASGAHLTHLGGRCMTRTEKRSLMLILAGFAAFGAWLGVSNRTHMNFVCQEDGFVEYSQAFLYVFAGAVFAWVAAHKGFRTIWHWGYAALFLLIGGEEVAW